MSYLTFTQNFWIAATHLSGPMFLAVTWSLAIEEQFYFTLPAVIRFLPRKHLWALALSMIAIAPVVRFFLSPTASYVHLPSRADELGMGLLCVLLVRSNTMNTYRPSAR
jgi:peptidoglycan/LPS O-acetylase OafA/YrhL